MLQITWFFKALGTAGLATVWDLDWYLHKILPLVPPFLYFLKLFHHHFSDLQIRIFLDRWGSWLRMRGLFSISKLLLSFFSTRSLLPPSYILCWREQSGLVIRIWFEMNREDSKGKTHAGGSDGSLLSLLSVHKRINPSLDSMRLHSLTLLWPSALSSLSWAEMFQEGVALFHHSHNNGGTLCFTVNIYLHTWA